MKFTHRIRRRSGDWWWALVLVATAATFLMGYVGFRQYYTELGQTFSTTDLIYRCLQLFFVDAWVEGRTNVWLQVARFLGPLAAGITLLRAVLTVFQAQVQKVRLAFVRNHYIVCSLSSRGTKVVEQLLERGDRVVVIEEDSSRDELRHCREIGAIVLEGSWNDRWMLERARLRRAKCLLAISDDDGTNIETAALARQMVQDLPDQLKQVVHVNQPALVVALMRHGLIADRDDHKFEFFNVYEIAARVMLREQIVVERPGITNLLIVGFDTLGQALLLRAVKDWRIDRADPSEKIRVTIVAEDAGRGAHRFRDKYSFVDELCELTTIDLAIDSRDFERGCYLCDETGEQIDFSDVHVCLPKDAVAGLATLTLLDHLKNTGVPITVAMAQQAGLATMLDTELGGSDAVRRVWAVGLSDLAQSLHMLLDSTTETLAQVIHHQYLKKALEDGGTPEKNPSLLPWHQLPESLKHSNRHQADDIRAKLEVIDCEIVRKIGGLVDVIELAPDEVERLAMDEHKRWMRERTDEGWTYGLRKDIERKKHPCLVDWSKLTQSQCEHDRDPVRRIPATLAKADLAVRRLKK